MNSPIPMTRNIDWATTGENRERRVFVIPVGTQSKEEVEKSISEMFAKYKDEIKFGDEIKITE